MGDLSTWSRFWNPEKIATAQFENPSVFHRLSSADWEQDKSQRPGRDKFPIQPVLVIDKEKGLAQELTSSGADGLDSTRRFLFRLQDDLRPWRISDLCMWIIE